MFNKTVCCFAIFQKSKQQQPKKHFHSIPQQVIVNSLSRAKSEKGARSCSVEMDKTYRNRALRFSGNSVLPAYPGFMVMKSPTVGTKEISSPWKMKRFFLSLIASWIDLTCTATTDNTSTEMRLNSSKQPQAPV